MASARSGGGATSGVTILEMVIVLAITALLAAPLVDVIVTNQRKVAGLPRRLCALYFAQDLLEERLDKRLYAQVRSISRRRMSEFSWIRKNVRTVEATEAGERLARVRRSLAFLRQFTAEVQVAEEVAGRRKRIRATVAWEEGGRLQQVTLVSVLEV
jgi:hypothetical protein